MCDCVAETMDSIYNIQMAPYDTSLQMYQVLMGVDSLGINLSADA